MGREVRQAHGVGLFDVALDLGVAAVTGFGVDDVVVFRLGDEDLVAPSPWVAEVELGADVRPLSPADGPGALGPAASSALALAVQGEDPGSGPCCLVGTGSWAAALWQISGYIGPGG